MKESRSSVSAEKDVNEKISDIIQDLELIQDDDEAKVTSSDQKILQEQKEKIFKLQKEIERAQESKNSDKFSNLQFQNPE